MSNTEPPEAGFSHTFDVSSTPLIVPENWRELIAIELFEIEKADYSEHLRFQASIGVAAVKTLFLINAGAVIGILTFIGNKGGDVVASGIRDALAAFVCGVVAAAAAQIPGYWAQIKYQEASHRLMLDFLRLRVGQSPANDHTASGQAGWRWVSAGLGLVVASLICFAVGAKLGIDSLILKNGAQVETVDNG